MTTRLNNNFKWLHLITKFLIVICRFIKYEVNYNFMCQPIKRLPFLKFNIYIFYRLTLNPSCALNR
jgi:hypothetical protein